MDFEELENNYNNRIRPKVLALIVEFKAEMGDVGRCMEFRSLWEQEDVLTDDIQDIFHRYVEATDNDIPYREKQIISMRLPQLEADLKKVNRKLRLIINEVEGKKSKSSITESMVENAREYPLSQIVEIDRRGFALCVAHDDSHPSMYCKKNFAYCFSCHFTGDVIDVYMKKTGCGFVDAVKTLGS